jgi:anti-sigma-K factor RskA
MCYDDKILSAYVDGELKEPLHTNVKNHIEGCERCRTLVAEYNALQELFTSTRSQVSETALESRERKARVWEEVQRHTRRERVQNFWHRRVQIPMPLAAGVLVAMIALVLTLVFNPLSTGQRTVPLALRDERIPEVPTEYVSPANTMPEIEQLVRFLSDQGAAIEVKIQLPSTSKIQVSGEPQLLRAAEYRGSEGE